MNIILSNLGLIIAGVVVVLLIAGFFMTGYVKAPTNKAFIISGIKKEPKVLIGQAGIKIPFFERKDELLLKQISIDIKTNGYIPTKDFIGVDIDAVAKVRVLTSKDVSSDKGITQEMVNAAMKNFLNMNENDIREALTDSLQGNMREIIGTQDLKELCTDRKTFGDEVQSKAQKDMNALGIWIESCNIQKLEDENNLITALGQDNMSQIKKNASIAKANADKEVAIVQSEAAKVANDARVESERAIAEKNNELNIKKAELKITADTKKAESDAAYEIQQQEQRKTIEAKTIEADIIKQDKQIELKKKEAEVQEQEFAASIKKKADADLYEAQKLAEADLYRRQKEAEAKKYEQEQEAEAIKAKSEAELIAQQNVAKGIEAVGEANAKAKKAELLAEAEGLDKKAEAMKKMDKAAVIQMIVDKLPEIVKNAAEPMSNIDKIVMYGGGENTSNNLVGNVMNTVSQVSEGLEQSMGLDVKSLIAGIVGGKIASNNTAVIEEETEE